MVIELLKNWVRRIKWLVRTGLGKDLYYRPQLRYPTELVGGDPATGYGAWPVCVNNLQEDAVVYSLGIGTDVSFDLEMIERFGIKVYAFDPTPTSIAWLEKQVLPSTFVSYPYGIADYDGEATFHAPVNPDHVSFSMSHDDVDRDNSVVAKVYRLGTLMEMLGHDHLDILKMDIEGAEYDVIQDILRTDVSVTQLLIEFHHRLSGVGLERTRKAVSNLNEAGYKLAHISSSGEEYVFIKNR